MRVASAVADPASPPIPNTKMSGTGPGGKRTPRPEGRVRGRWVPAASACRPCSSDGTWPG